MKLTKIPQILATVALLSGVFVMSCKKDNNSGSTAKNDSTAADMSAAANASGSSYNDVLNVAGEASIDNGIEQSTQNPVSGRTAVSSTHASGSGNYSGSCAVYTFRSNGDAFPDTVTADFGSGCTGTSGIARSGQVQMIFSGRLTASGTTISTTFTNYTVWGYELQGTFSITNRSTESALAFETSVANGNVTFPNAVSYTYTGHHVSTQTAGNQTPTDFTDDVYSITGSQTCGSSLGNTLSDTTATPLIKSNDCQWISQGVLNFTFNNISGTFDYGTGTCDDQAEIVVGNYKQAVTLK